MSIDSSSVYCRPKIASYPVCCAYRWKLEKTLKNFSSITFFRLCHFVRLVLNALSLPWSPGM